MSLTCIVGGTRGPGTSLCPRAPKELNPALVSAVLCIILSACTCVCVREDQKLWSMAPLLVQISTGHLHFTSFCMSHVMFQL